MGISPTNSSLPSSSQAARPSTVSPPSLRRADATIQRLAVRNCRLGSSSEVDDTEGGVG
jgi:hypothetical protein